jgi:hypothetical protein
MASKHDLEAWIVDALNAQGGRASLIAVSRHIWKSHEEALRKSGDLFYTWQYDLRWAANRLRSNGVMKGIEKSPRGTWELA